MIKEALLEGKLSRRDVLKVAGTGALAAMLPKGVWAADAKPKIQLSLQLYSIRGDCGKDFDAALDWVAKTGFDGVEFAGYYAYGGKATELRKRLDDLGLKAAGTHIGSGSFRGDALQKTIEFHQTIGCKFLCVPGDGAFTDPEKSKELADLFNKTAEVLKPLNMACGYHNHKNEFKKDGDKTYWDLFAERTSKDVVLQQDCGWSAAAGYDPVELIKRYPGRTRITHFKPTVVGPAEGKKAYIGQDGIDWSAIYVACRDFGATEWATLEQEAYPEGKTPMECTAISFAGLKKLIADLKA